MSVTIDDPSFVLICPFSAPSTNRVSDIKRMRTRTTKTSSRKPNTRVKTLPVSSNGFSSKKKERRKKSHSSKSISLCEPLVQNLSLPLLISFSFFFSRKDYNLKNDLALISYAARCSRPVPVMSIQCVASRDTNARGVCLPMRRLDSSSPIRVALLSKKS